MTLEEAKKILLKSRPERPRKTEARQLQRAIDVVLTSLEEYEDVYKSAPISIVDKTKYSGCFNCSRHAYCYDAFQPHSIHCGAYGGSENGKD